MVTLKSPKYPKEQGRRGTPKKLVQAGRDLLLRHRSRQACADKLVQQAVSYGGPDKISIIIARRSEM